MQTPELTSSNGHSKSTVRNGTTPSRGNPQIVQLLHISKMRKKPTLRGTGQVQYILTINPIAGTGTYNWKESANSQLLPKE